MICSPETFTSKNMQKYITENRQDANQEWIFNLIARKYRMSEIVLCCTDDWTLCRDMHTMQNKWLVVYHDLSLHSIRDLRACHIDMLLTSQRMCRQELRKKKILSDSQDAIFFFHFMPSVYQLHMHVHIQDNMASESTRPHIRRHLLHQVVRNLIMDEQFYAKALILTSLPKTLKYAGVFSRVFDSFDGPSTASGSTVRHKTRDVSRESLQNLSLDPTQDPTQNLALDSISNLISDSISEMCLDPDSESSSESGLESSSSLTQVQTPEYPYSSTRDSTPPSTKRASVAGWVKCSHVMIAPTTKYYARGRGKRESVPSRGRKSLKRNHNYKNNPFL